ncbi:translocating chain-associated membrane protein 2 isoform X2 [Amia ocellicauda]|uniref:translocating chain-associated membrane protein 2 isoform X2 n=1 Tax=Amia ocellicauda TaxID=2972642 RepID=UPI0034647C57
MAFRRRNKSYPFFSQEFLIQNHADIVFCLVVFILIGLMFEATAKTAFLFILPQYNSSISIPEGEVSVYHCGWRDCVTILFYFLITIILHAVVQEYVLDEGYLLNLSSLWENYPHVHLRFQVKFFYLFQIAYWLHALPELYFQKVRKEEIPRHLKYISLYLLHISLAYLLNLTRVGLVLLFLQYLSELGFHVARLFYFTDESHHKLFDMWAVGFILTRMVTLTLSVLAVGFGLGRVESQGMDWEAGNFNTLPLRMAVLLLVCLTQAWLLWKFIRFQLRRWREYRQEQAARRRSATRQPARTVKSGHHENGVIKAENGASPRPKKIKTP